MLSCFPNISTGTVYYCFHGYISNNVIMEKKKKIVQLLPSLRPPSIILEHHPEAHGTASTPFSFSTSVEFTLNGSLQLPKSPLDRQEKHLRTTPENKVRFSNII